MLIEVLFDDLTGLPEGCIQRWDDWTHWRVFEFFSRELHLTLRQSDALTGFRICLLSGCRIANYWRCQKCCTWRWGGQMHWRVFGFLPVRLHPTLRRLDALAGWRCFAKGLYLTLKQSDALTGLRILPESCTWHWGSQVHWRFLNFRRRLDVFLAVSATGVVARFWLIDAGRQVSRRGARNLLLTAKYVGWGLQGKVWLKWRKQADR